MRLEDESVFLDHPVQFDVYRPSFHLQPYAGWLNDPNGPVRLPRVGESAGGGTALPWIKLNRAMPRERDLNIPPPLPAALLQGQIPHASPGTLMGMEGGGGDWAGHTACLSSREHA